MSWLSYFYPQTVGRFTSFYNKDIRVVEEQGRYKILVNGSRQSGPYIEMLWRKALSSFSITKNLPVKRILVLGVAGGNVIHLLRKMYPSASIVGVDIDQVMIDIGKQYFGLAGITKLQLVRVDAKAFIAQKNQKHRFDLVIVDTFFGRHSASFVTTRQFLLNLKALLRPEGAVIINYLRELEYQTKSEQFFQTLQGIFPLVRDKPIFRNRFFYAQ